jgi:NADPH:quinone reductase-like Zn-dependent oxidoreductase
LPLQRSSSYRALPHLDANVPKIPHLVMHRFARCYYIGCNHSGEKGREFDEGDSPPQVRPPDVLELGDIDEPELADVEVLLRVRATSVIPADWHLLRGEPYIARVQLGLRKPKDRGLGCDVAGRVEAVGKNVTMLERGGEVFGTPFMHGLGAFAERVRISEDLLAPKPANLSFEQAAAVPLAVSTALQGLRDYGRIEPGQKVLIIGASEGVGTFAVQIARSFEAEVSGVCSSRNVEMVRSLGADHVIGYIQEDFARSGHKYDLIFQLAGSRSPSECRRAHLRGEARAEQRRVGGSLDRWPRLSPLEPWS